MTDLDILRAAVLADPDDDLPRRAFADALEEAGSKDEANTIRRQVADPAEEIALIVGFTPNGEIYWPGAIYRKLPDHSGVVLRRGFIETLRLPMADFCEPRHMVAMGRLFANSPIIEVILTDREPRSVDIVDAKIFCALGVTWPFWWSRNDQPSHRGDLPGLLYGTLRRHVYQSWTGINKGYATREDALTDLGEACLQIGRTLAKMHREPSQV
jgi:uncharacterized protein (TIGR02996 family)